VLQTWFMMPWKAQDILTGVIIFFGAGLCLLDARILLSRKISNFEE
jgi:hypothetical protein